MQNRFKIEFRHKQVYYLNDSTQPVIVICNSDGTATYKPGTVPNPNWVDVTDNTDGLADFTLQWSALAPNYTSNGSDTTPTATNQFGSNFSKGVTDELTFYGAAFQFIYEWLMTDPCQILNAIEVRITDMAVNKAFSTFELKLDNLNYTPIEAPCIVKLSLAEADLTWHNFQKTIIEDDWQHWFNSDGKGTKQHPTFPYLIEHKPKLFLAIYAVLIYVVGMLSSGIIVANVNGKKWIRRTLGFSYFCPSPLIRTYIENACKKYGFTFDTIFDDKPENPYRDTCLFYPVSASYKNFEDYKSPSTLFINDNRTVYSLPDFLDLLKVPFNAEWYITAENKLIFKHKSYFENLPITIDFTNPNGIKLWHLQYTYNGTKKPSYGNYQYTIDPADTCSNEIKNRYNAIVDYDGKATNPLLEGRIEKTIQFGATAFNNDGTGENFIEEAVKLGRIIASAALLIGLGELFTASNFITVGIVAGILSVGYAVTNNYVNMFFNNSHLNGIVRVSSSEINTPRLLLWDRATPLNEAKVVSEINPKQNPFFNTEKVNYYQNHPGNDVPPSYFGSTVKNIYNYPLYIDHRFYGNLYDRFLYYDNPLTNLVINQSWQGDIDLCEEALTTLGTFEGDNVKIGAKVILENRNGRLISGRITDIQANYKTGNITLKGNVLK